MRREIVHTFFNRSPIAAPIQTGQTLAGVVTGKLNASDPNGDPLTATVTRQGAFGTVGLAADGTYTYTPTVTVPATGLTDSFQVAIDDSGGAHLRGVLGAVEQFFHSVALAVGLAQPDTVVKTVNVVVAGSVVGGSIPSVVLTSGPLVYPSTGGPKPLDPAVTVVDVDSAQLSGAKVSISVGYDALTDSLGYSSAGGPVTGSFDAATGTLTLSGTATVAQYQAALRSVTFTSTAADLVGARTASIVVTADGVDSLPGLVAVVMAGVPVNVPSVVLASPVKLYTGNGTPVVLDSNVIVADVDSTQATGATVTIGAGYTAGVDTLGYTGPLSSSFDDATGTLTLTGAASVADYQAALRSVTFASTATVGVKTVSMAVTTDGTVGTPGVIAVTVAALPPVGLPSVVLTTPATLYTGNGTPVVLDSNVIVADVDSTQATGATVQIGAGYTAGVDTLGYTGRLSSSFDDATGTLTLTGDASVADYQAALRSVTFASTATVGVKTVSMSVITDGTVGTPGIIAVTVAALPPATGLPSVVLTSPATLYTGNGTPVVLDSNVIVADVDSTQATGATVTIGVGYSAGVDTLGYTGPLSSSFDDATGTLTLTGDASIADYQAALRSVTFASTATVGVKTVSMSVVTDGTVGTPGVIALTVAALPPVGLPSVVLTTPATLYTGNGTPVVLDSNVVVADVDSTQATGATVQIGAGYTAGVDTLGYTGPLSSSFDNATGTLTLTGDASVADYQAALRSVTFASTAMAGVKTVSMSVITDGATGTPGTIVVTVAAPPASTGLPSVVLTTPATLYTGNGTPVVLDSNVIVADVDSTQATGATVTIGVGYTAGVDTLAYTGPLSSSFDDATGTLTLTGDASVADYQAALRSVTFASTATVGVKTVSMAVVTDGTTGTPGTIVVTVAAPPASTGLPSVVLTSPATLYTGNGTPVVLDSNVVVADVDSTQATSATVKVTTGYAAGVDTLGYTGPLSSSFDDATGTLTLSGDASVADYQAALRSVTFASTATVGVKTVSMAVITDGATGTPGIIAVTVAAPPVSTGLPSVVLTSPATLYVGNGTPVVLDSNVIVADVDSTQATSATVKVTTGYTAGVDTLGYTGPLSSSFDDATGTLTLTGDASVADYQAALRSVTFASTATVGVKTVSMSVITDGAAGTPGTIVVTVAAPPVSTGLPSVVLTTPATLYTGNGTPVVLDSNVVVADVDSTLATGATVTIGAGYTAGVDTLGYTGPLSSSFDDATGTLTLTGDASIADYQTALRSVTFASTATAGVKTVSMAVITDGATGTPGTIVVTAAAPPAATNVPPLVVTSGALTYTAGGAAVALDPGMTVVDIDSPTLAGATVSIAIGYVPGTDSLNYSTIDGIGGVYDAGTGVLTLTGVASAAQYQQALRSVTFATTASALAAIKAVSVVVTDGTAASIPGTVAVTVLALPVDVPPLVATSLLSAVPYTAGSAPVQLDPSVTVTDLDSTFLSGAQVSITGGFAAGDTLSFTQGNGISGTYDSSTGVLTLSGAATVANYQQALRSVAFATNSSAIAALKTVSMVVTDFDGASSVSLPLTVAVASLPINVAPVVVSSLANPVPYTAGNSPAVLDGAVTILEDSNTLTGATISLGITKQSGDTLAFTPPSGSSITGTYDATTGVLTLTGTGTVDQYQTALRSVTFATTSAGLVGLRTVTMAVTDGSGAQSISVPLAVTVVANTAPVVSTTLVSALVYTTGSGPTPLDPGFGVADSSTFMSGATVSITAGKGSSDALTFTPANGITGSYNAATGVLTLSGTATAAQYQSLLRSVNFSTTTSTLFSAARTFAVGVTDQQGLTGTVVLLMTVLGL
ncbi:hypothetical protein MMAD_46360 [Mycolicibacterium madagascariense]|uniref:Uncharacterized protein n=1 Tax=Mycolicibacterium madagascariense TaxID=212765 RepID=A0A7I7XM84_9MYCO|nr:hypothetical protein MMAD_46360 [Mycolicibacterium madagascariense]